MFADKDSFIKFVSKVCMGLAAAEGEPGGDERAVLITLTDPPAAQRLIDRAVIITLTDPPAAQRIVDLVEATLVAGYLADGTSGDLLRELL